MATQDYVTKGELEARLTPMNETLGKVVDLLGQVIEGMVTKSAYERDVTIIKAELSDIKSLVEGTNRLVTMLIEDKQEEGS